MPTSLAASADPFHLYELAVQCPAAEVAFLDRAFHGLRGRRARLLREDFCGTAALCRAWVGLGPAHAAIGIDHDAAVLAWARARLHSAPVAPADAGLAGRLRLVEGDCRRPPPVATGPAVAVGSGDPLLRADQQPIDLPLADLTVALNFSYWLIRERAALRDYFVQVRAGLVADGVLFLDAFGGADALRLLTESRRIDDGGAGFAYVWEQAAFDPISGEQRCHIHFVFPDGSRLSPAFSFTWRLWTLPELRELLVEAGFGRVTCYWQGWDRHGLPDGQFRPTRIGRADAGWICYLAACRD